MESSLPIGVVETVLFKVVVAQLGFDLRRPVLAARVGDPNRQSFLVK